MMTTYHCGEDERCRSLRHGPKDCLFLDLRGFYLTCCRGFLDFPSSSLRRIGRKKALSSSRRARRDRSKGDPGAGPRGTVVATRSDKDPSQVRKRPSPPPQRVVSCPVRGFI